MFAAAPPLFTLTDFIPLAIFGLFAAVAWFALEYMAAAKPRALERLDEIKNPQKRRSAQAEAILKKPDTMSKVLEKTSALTKSFAPKNEAEANKLKNHLASAGFRAEGLVPIFYGLKFVMLMAGFFLGGGTLLWVEGLQPEHADLGGGRERPLLLAAGHRPGVPGAAAGSRRSSWPCPTSWT